MAVSINVTFDLPRRPPRRTAVLAAVAALILSVPTGVFASHLFTDVPTSNTFHANIANVATAGLTTGCSATTYCPTDAVTRGQMAAFLNRGLGRVSEVEFALPVTGTDDATVGSVTITPGIGAAAVSGAKQFVFVDVAATLLVTNASGCPCVVGLQIDGVDGFITAVTIPGTGYFPISTSGVMAVTTSGPVTITATTYIALAVGGGTPSTAYTAYGSMTALMVPFGSTGSSVAGPGTEPADVPGVPAAH